MLELLYDSDRKIKISRDNSADYYEFHFKERVYFLDLDFFKGFSDSGVFSGLNRAKFAQDLCVRYADLVTFFIENKNNLEELIDILLLAIRNESKLNKSA